jgi:hypothetical protein
VNPSRFRDGENTEIAAVKRIRTRQVPNSFTSLCDFDTRDASHGGSSPPPSLQFGLVPPREPAFDQLSVSFPPQMISSLSILTLALHTEFILFSFLQRRSTPPSSHPYTLNTSGHAISLTISRILLSPSRPSGAKKVLERATLHDRYGPVTSLSVTFSLDCKGFYSCLLLSLSRRRLFPSYSIRIDRETRRPCSQSINSLP